MVHPFHNISTKVFQQVETGWDPRHVRGRRQVPFGPKSWSHHQALSFSMYREGGRWGGVQAISWCKLQCLLVLCFASRSCPAMLASPKQARSGTAPQSTSDRIGRSAISGHSKQFLPEIQKIKKVRITS